MLDTNTKLQENNKFSSKSKYIDKYNSLYYYPFGAQNLNEKKILKLYNEYRSFKNNYGFYNCKSLLLGIHYIKM